MCKNSRHIKKRTGDRVFDVIKNSGQANTKKGTRHMFQYMTVGTFLYLLETDLTA